MTTPEEKLVRGAFAGWKLDAVQAIASDHQLQPSDVRVAVTMLRFLSAGTLTLYPSQKRLAKLSCMSLNNVVSCLNRLRDAGWISWDRGNRQLANLYRFEPDHIADEMARVKREEQQYRADRKRRKPSSDHQPTVGQNAASDHQPTVGRDHQPAGSQHLNGNIPTEISDLKDVA